jgi:hypothetical protein
VLISIKRESSPESYGEDFEDRERESNWEMLMQEKKISRKIWGINLPPQRSENGITGRRRAAFCLLLLMQLQRLH